MGDVLRVPTIRTASLAAVVLAGACGQEPTLHGVLKATLDSVFRTDQSKTCESERPSADFGPLTGCRQTSGNELVYFLRDSAGKVVLVGRQWESPNEPDTAVLAAALEREYGRPTVCSHSSVTNWRIQDQRWQKGALYTALLRMEPVEGLGVHALTRLVKGIGVVRCDDLFGVPLRR